MDSLNSRCCRDCGKELRGRSDKKFCDDICRSSFNNRIYSVASLSIRNINAILKRNRQILASCLPSEGKVRIRGRKLLEQGFDPSYFTHVRSSRTGAEFRFCYEFGFRFTEDETCLVVGRRS